MNKINARMINEFSVLSSETSCFKLVYEQKSINAAARKVGQDPGHISRTISKLEQGMGSKLFVRHKTGLTPTAHGQLLYRAILAMHEAYVENIHQKDKEQKLIRIGFSPAIGYSHFQSQLVQRILAGNLRPQFTLSHSAELVELIKLRSLDFALVHNAVKFPGIISKHMTTENLVLCSLSGDQQKVLVLNPDMLGIEKFIFTLSYENRWDLKDYFVIAQLLSGNETLMGVLPESLLKTHPKLKIIKTLSRKGVITALTWPGSEGTQLLKSTKK